MRLDDPNNVASVYVLAISPEVRPEATGAVRFWDRVRLFRNPPVNEEGPEVAVFDREHSDPIERPEHQTPAKRRAGLKNAILREIDLGGLKSVCHPTAGDIQPWLPDLALVD
ncbi:hypothetical protein GCM10009657_41460 [Oryzihumus leptocrescens]